MAIKDEPGKLEEQIKRECEQAITILTNKDAWDILRSQETQVEQESLRPLIQAETYTVWIDQAGKPWFPSDNPETPMRGHIWALPLWKLTRRASFNNGTSKYFEGIKKKTGGNNGMRSTPRTTTIDVTDPAVPVSWFTAHSYMSPGQALSLFLHDELELTWTEAGRLINKAECTIRRSYSFAAEKKEAHEARSARQKKRDRDQEYAKSKKPTKPKKAACSNPKN